MGFRWNVGLGPIRYSAPLFRSNKGKLPPQHGKALGVTLVVASMLCCCGVVTNSVLSGNESNSDQEPIVSETTYAPAFLPTLPSEESVSPSPIAIPTTVKPSPKPSSKPTPRKTTTSPKPRVRTTTKSPTPTTDHRYKTCAEANDHGLGPYYKGVDPEYYWYIDRDKDGVVCES